MQNAITDWIANQPAILDWIVERVMEEFHEEFWKIDPTALRSDLDLFSTGNDDKSPAELAEIADRLSVGGAHTSGFLTRYAMKNILFADPTLVAALLYRNWKGGKVGFQFLPNPATTPFEEYSNAVSELESWFDETEPTKLLLNTYSDLDFYNSLPDSFTVYRGGSHCSPEALAAGICWTTSRPVAEWFANRASRDEPILLSARIRKWWVRLAFSSEFEVVVTPLRWRQLKCPSRQAEWRPPMEWKKETR